MMDALDEETKDSILRNIGELFPNVSDLSFFRQVFDNENWDLEKSLETIKSLLEYADEEEAIDSFTPPSNNARVPSPPPELPNTRIIAPNPAPASNFVPMSGLNESVSGFSTSGRNPLPGASKMLYSSSMVKSGTVPKSTANDKKVTPASKSQRKEKLLKAYNDGLKQKNPVLRIKSFALEGIKVMIIMRGCPGSGKTYLVQHLANSLSVEQSKALGWTVAHPVDHHIFSADDFWINPAEKYVFNSEYIEYAHRWNQKLVRQAASEGRSPIFVDNTHTRLWEMQAVATIAVEYGYIIEIIDSKEVNKKWAFNVSELVRRNVHGVHYDAIKRMVERYELDIRPKHIFKTYNLSYHPNMIPPQRCLVTFSTPPSKNQMKIFNTRFHFAPLKDILALKFSESGAEISVNSGSKTRNAPRLDWASNVAVPEKDPRNPVIYRATPKRNEELVYQESDSMGHNKTRVGINELPQKDGNYPVQYPPQFPWKASPPDSSFGFNVSHATSPYQIGCPPGQNQDAQSLLNPTEYIWSSPYPADTTPASRPAETSVDLLLSLNEDATDTKSKWPLLPQQFPTKSSDSDNLGSCGPHDEIFTNNSNSGSDLLLSFEKVSQVTSRSSSISISSHFHSPDGELITTPRVSPCKEVGPDAEDDNNDSDFSCEDIPMTLPSDACNEFGHKVTSEYVLVEPDGYLKFQHFHEGLPITLNEFVATSKMERLKNKLAKSVARRDSGPANKLMKPFFKKVSDVPMYSNDMLLLGKSLGEAMSESANPSACHVKPVKNEATFDAQGQGSKGNVPSDLHLPKGTQSESFTCLGITPEEFINQVWSRNEAKLSENRASQFEKFDSPAGFLSSAEMVAPIVESTWIEPKEPELVKMSRSDSPKRQRSQVDRTLTKKCNKGTDANYFEILSKANTSDVLSSNDAILFGNASSFKSSPSPPKQDGIKAVATHEKSSMTKGDESADQIDSGIEILTKMFPDVSLDCLVDLFEKCQKNLYWTANLLMDSGEEISEHFNADVAPKRESPPPSPLPKSVETPSEPSSKESLTAPSSLKKLKKHKHKLTEEYLDLVKEFESNFTLNEEHYSETLKKVRETRFGRPVEAEAVEDPCTSRDSTPTEPETSSSDIWDDDEGDMSLLVSNDLIGQLQNKFGPIPNIYGSSELVMKLPVSLARQIYSYALDSICQEIEEEQNVFDLLIKEDEAFARKLQEESDDSRRGAMSFQEIMDHELALRAHEKEQGQLRAAPSETFASRLSHQLLAERFPNMDPATLQSVLDVTNHSLHQATNLLAEAGHAPVDPAIQKAVKNTEKEPVYTMTREESIEQANAYHDVAAKLNDMRHLYLQKAKESYNSGNHAVALFYRELFTWYSDQIKASNAKAAKMMLHGNEGATTLDLHYLLVSEAVGVLDLFLDESIRQLSARKREIFIITGRGLHSLDGKSRIKPAIKQRLKQRGLRYGEVNPGMLKTVITKSSTVSYKLNGVH